MANGIDQPGPIRLFYSYAHADEALRRKLEAQLAALRRAGLIIEWHDRMIQPGQKWAAAIDRNLAEADVILLLVSSDFINSDYCWSVEMTAALAREKRGEAIVVAVILRPCQWQLTTFADLQAIPTNGEPVTSRSWASEDEAFNDVAAQIGGLVTKLRAKWERRGIGALPTKPKLRLDETDALYADPRYASAYVHAPTQDARAGEGLRVRLGASFGQSPGAELPRLNAVEVRIDLPAGPGAETILGQPLAVPCGDGIELLFRGPSPKRPSWCVAVTADDATLSGRNVSTEEAPLFLLPRAQVGECLRLTMVAFANKDFYQGRGIPQQGADSATLSKAKERIIARLRLKLIGEPAEDGEIVLCTTENGVEEVPE